MVETGVPEMKLEEMADVIRGMATSKADETATNGTAYPPCVRTVAAAI
jgi:hypothetical protein